MLAALLLQFVLYQLTQRYLSIFITESDTLHGSYVTLRHLTYGQNGFRVFYFGFFRCSSLGTFQSSGRECFRTALDHFCPKLHIHCPKLKLTLFIGGKHLERQSKVKVLAAG